MCSIVAGRDKSIDLNRGVRLLEGEEQVPLTLEAQSS